MAHRFFISDIPMQGEVSLDGDQARHAVQVMRFGEGDEIDLFDGRGVQATCVIKTAGKKKLLLEILRREESDRALSSEITIAVALPKSDRQKFLIEKLVELGVGRLIPLTAERSVATANAKVIARLEKQVVEASKQCERNRLMEVHSPMSFAEIQQWASERGEARLWIADPYDGVSIAQANQAGSANELVAIGPEGGFTDQELHAACELGFAKLRIGPTILRVETAAIAAAAIFGAGREKFA